MRTGHERTAIIRWSVVIPAYNCAHFLADALGEVVAQLGYREDAEIIVVDDGSTDDPGAVVRVIGRGQVRFESNPDNLGAIGTFNRCIDLAQGELVHILHGDDIVLAGFYRAMEDAMAGSSALAAMCRTVDIDEEGELLHESRRYQQSTGIWPGAFDALLVSNRVRAPGIVVRRSAYEKYGSFRADLPHAADWEMWTRLAAAGPIVFVDEMLAGYRKHGASDSSHRMRSGANIRERVAAIGMISEHVTAARRPAMTRKALLYSFAYAARTSWGQARSHQWQVAATQAREGVRCLIQVPRALKHAEAAAGCMSGDRPSYGPVRSGIDGF